MKYSGKIADIGFRTRRLSGTGQIQPLKQLSPLLTSWASCKT